jgi:hypothetical protein
MSFGLQIHGDFSSVSLGSLIEIGNAHNKSLYPYACVDENCYCVNHRVDHGMFRQGTVPLNSWATLHPNSILMMGSLGRGS